jgi:hypothetical protein
MDKGGRTAALIHVSSEFAYRPITLRTDANVFDTVAVKAKLNEIIGEPISRCYATAHP